MVWCCCWGDNLVSGGGEERKGEPASQGLLSSF